MPTPRAIGAIAVDQLFTGTIRPLENDGADTGLHKSPVTEPRWLDSDGVADDMQADLQNHGGPHRALSHYPADHYPFWQARFVEKADAFIPGVLGENISTTGITEADVSVGDIFTLGEVTIQLAEPRQPCWKIARRLNVPKLARDVAACGRAGWFYRVLESGHIAPGDRLERIERADHGISLAELWSIQATPRPDANQMERMAILAELNTMSPSWRQRLSNRHGRLCGSN